MLVETSYEQEECVEMNPCDMSLPELFKAKESAHTDEIELEMPEINELEVKELPRIINEKSSQNKISQNLYMLNGRKF